ncbi:GNAT family N-acyltransferase [Thiomicrorhabdus xiamenensis]|uniref:L-ornithine N(alpha)-acyltransferase n=1 Tax=Thiomicrorhabdus xiamenensis TaxID=2739063 RepID=A0A7D4P3R4_9GAMM|nr:lysophospholipid acyltransferase family protein [Thiomicrorhabdus xiamenensis]QKI88355.1 lysophospholipid acyltransferase family protein [Thiomicrorhabdus xiamenensis]
MLHIEQAIAEKWPNLSSKPAYPLIVKMLKKLLHEDEINQFIETNRHLRGFAFLDQVLEHFEFSYQVNHSQLNRIPADGKVIIVANHPIGSLDGLALLKLVRSVRPDVRIVANDLLANIQPLQDLFLPLDNLNGNSHKAAFKAMLHALENEQAVIIFPAGEVSRIRPNGVKDGPWKSGFLKLARKSQAPVLPICIDARNSALFYSLSTLYKPLGTLMLVQEMFNKKAQQIEFHIGKAISSKTLAASDIQGKRLANAFRKHLYRLGKPKKLKKKPFLPTMETIAHPIDRKALRQSIINGQLLGETQDRKKIYLFDYDANSPVMHEIGRLRELTFRTVEEGTGKTIDLDHYDALYQHLVLWDEEEWEIVGAYRLGRNYLESQKRNKTGAEIYCTSLFEFNDRLQQQLPQALELGRSFVQPKYWGKRSLDYLWFGIGAYLQRHPEIKYMFGPVSLSNAYPQTAKELIAGFYLQQFGDFQSLATARQPFNISPASQAIAAEEFSGDYSNSLKKLNALLALEGVKLPTLFKQYAELCEDKGCRFIDFNIDPLFSDCIDAFIFVEIDKIKAKKRNRYMPDAAVEEPTNQPVPQSAVA